MFGIFNLGFCNVQWGKLMLFYDYYVHVSQHVIREDAVLRWVKGAFRQFK